MRNCVAVVVTKQVRDLVDALTGTFEKVTVGQQFLSLKKDKF